jgi:selenocysteine lyase/cysteine desulfurase
MAACAPYVDINMQRDGMDAVFLSPHKFVGGPGTPGVLCVRYTFANCTGASAYPPSTASGGTVKMVYPDPVTKETKAEYHSDLIVKEEGGTPSVMESIRCGLVFRIRNLVGLNAIERTRIPIC